MKLKLVSGAIVVAGLVALSPVSLNAGNWQHTQSSPGSFSQNVTVPAATCQQVCEGALASNVSTNDGPLANFQVVGIGYQSQNGAVAAGTYSIYQAETTTNGGFSITVFNW